MLFLFWLTVPCTSDRGLSALSDLRAYPIYLHPITFFLYPLSVSFPQFPPRGYRITPIPAKALFTDSHTNRCLAAFVFIQINESQYSHNRIMIKTFFDDGMSTFIRFQYTAQVSGQESHRAEDYLHPPDPVPALQTVARSIIRAGIISA